MNHRTPITNAPDARSPFPAEFLPFIRHSRAGSATLLLMYYHSRATENEIYPYHHVEAAKMSGLTTKTIDKLYSILVNFGFIVATTEEKGILRIQITEKGQRLLTFPENRAIPPTASS